MSLMLLFTGLSLGAEEGIPDGLRVSLVSDQSTYFLGENILLHYRIDNAGETPLKFFVGGDYFIGRSGRLKVSANMVDGGAVADPSAVSKNSGRAGGGAMHYGELAPGASWYESVWVIRYCRFDQPGKFTIRAFHDLGFGKPSERDAREVSVSIELLAPTEAQAEAILTAEEKLPLHYGNSWGKKGVARLDYDCIRWQTFLKPLAFRAQNGNLKAVDGIASIRNLDATRELVRLLVHQNPAVATSAADHLEWRLPLTEKEFQGPWGGRLRVRSVQDAWNDSLVPEVRDYALKLLASRQRESLLAAARLLQRVGTPSEVAALIESIEFAMAQKTPEYAQEISYPTCSDRATARCRPSFCPMASPCRNECRCGGGSQRRSRI